ncbi:MAG: DUF4411 family protein [Candidatus Nanopelagicales bacterium]|nr:DUF4411 family protein [Candidatus Nanopelagicales bacterium]
MKYTLDTNILINLAHQYPRDIFGSIWDSIEQAVAQGDVCICEAVLHELHRGGDDLYRWAKSLSGFMCSSTDEELMIVAEIASAHPDWTRGQLNEADPFVIAHAQVQERVVVTEEKRKGPNAEDRNQKIPNIADEYDVDCLLFFEFVRQMGWKF